MIEVNRRGAADPERLWRALSDVERWPGIIPTVDAVTRVAGASVGFEPGARFCVAQPRLRTAEYVVTACEPGRSFTWEAGLPGMRAIATHSLVVESEHECEVRLTMRWTGPMALVARVGYTRLARDYMEQEARAVFAAADATA